MKITQIETNNVKGLANGIYSLQHVITVISGPNGSGKSTLIDIIQYLLCGGKAPEKFVKNGTKKGIVTFKLDHDGTENEIIISKTAAENSDFTFKLNGKSTSMKNIREFISSCDGGGQIVRYSDVLNNMKPKELADTLLSYIPESNGIDTIISFLTKEYQSKNVGEENFTEWKDGNKQAQDILKNLLPPTVERSHLISALEQCKAEKSVVKKAIESMQYTFMQFQQIDFTNIIRTPEEIQEQIGIINAEIQNRNVIAEAWNQYQKSVDAVNQYNQHVTSLYEQINSIQAVEPDQEEISRLNDLLNQWDSYKQNLIQSISSNNTSLKIMQDALDKLSTPVCPLSDKLCCTVDKTPIQAELNANIAGFQSAIAELTQKCQEADVTISNIAQTLQGKQDNMIAWNRRQQIVEQYNQMLAKQPQAPVPPAVQIPDIQEKQNLLVQLNQELNLAQQKAQMYILTGQISEMQIKYHIYNYLVRELDPKGSVMENIMNAYVSKLNILLKDKVAGFCTDWELGFVFDNGIVPTVKIGSAESVPFPVLSTGQKAVVALFITDMLNSLDRRQVTDANGKITFTGPKTLLIDDLEKLDTKNFHNFINAVSQPDIMTRYENIIINVVNHSELLNEIQTRSDINSIAL